MRWATLLVTTLPALRPSPAPAQEAAEVSVAAAAAPEPYALHFQSTVATQAHPAFAAPYSGRNSMMPGSESATSIVTDLFAGVRLWPGAELYFQPELSGGRGLSGTVGVAAFPSGEVYRVGDPTPQVVVARAFLRQVFGLGGGTVPVEPGPSQLGGRQDRDRLTIKIGKLAVPDVVDVVPLSDDPHTHFMSWGLFASAAYDYPADTRGYTWGAAADLSVGWWSARAGLFLEPTSANGAELESNIAKARGLVAEAEVRYTLAGRPGATRLLGFLNQAHMGSYQAALAVAPSAPDVTATRSPGRTKAGFAASANQDLGRGLGVFVRVSYNDGANETWAFTEIDRSVGAGAVQSGERWGRPGDEVGLGIVVSGLSDLHHRYLAAGGYGFLLGDGALRYEPEILAEVYYRAALTHEISLGVGYQPVLNPGFNADRGPIHVFTARAHVAL